MPYIAEIRRTNPNCLVFVVDQSRSMNDKLAGEDVTKAEFAALAINNLLRKLVLDCTKGDGIHEYFYIGVIGYGHTVGSAFVGPLAGRGLVSINEIGNNLARIELRKRKQPDGVGGIVETTIRVPIWVDPVANGGTPMTQAMKLTHSYLTNWLIDHPNCFPPTVFHLTDGESTDGDLDCTPDSRQTVKVVLFGKRLPYGNHETASI